MNRCFFARTWCCRHNVAQGSVQFFDFFWCDTYFFCADIMSCGREEAYRSGAGHMLQGWEMPSSWTRLMSGLTCTVDHVSANKQINTSTMCGFKRSDQRSASNIALIKEAIIDRLQAQKPSTIGHGSLSEISFPLSQYAIVYIYNRICIRIFDLPNCPAALSLESSTCPTPQRLFCSSLRLAGLPSDSFGFALAGSSP